MTTNMPFDAVFLKHCYVTEKFFSTAIGFALLCHVERSLQKSQKARILSFPSVGIAFLYQLGLKWGL